MAVSFKTAARALRCDGGTTSPDIGKAVQFLAASARVVDRRRYERLFEGGDGAPPVRDAVAAYRNPDGGFGHALEPDGRAPASQPAAVELALRICTRPACGTRFWSPGRVPRSRPPPRPKAGRSSPTRA